MESNQNFGELSWPTDFGLVGLVSGPPSSPDLLRRRLLPKKTPWFESLVESDLSPAMPGGICRICLYPIESQLSWSPAIYGGLRPCRQQKNITEDSVMSLSCSGSQD